MIRFVSLVSLVLAVAALEFESELGNPTQCFLADGTTSCGDCAPGCEYCGVPYGDAPQFHLMDQQGCAENDPNGPVYDPVHGVIHHFYQIHLAAAPGHGPDYGHFVSKDFVTWAALPVAIWNGLDSSVWPPRVTPYDNEAIFTGSASVIDGKPFIVCKSQRRRQRRQQTALTAGAQTRACATRTITPRPRPAASATAASPAQTTPRPSLLTQKIPSTQTVRDSQIPI